MFRQEVSIFEFTETYVALVLESIAIYTQLTGAKFTT
jgi:hypothetical protein